MFIQVIQARSSRQDEVRTLMREWSELTDNSSSGFLGSTAGFTDDGTFINVVRFESREKAVANSDRPETDAMAQRMGELMDGPPEFHDCDDVTEFLGGGSDDAGFVQVIQGHTDDPEAVKAMMAGDEDQMRRDRPDIIGGTFAVDANGDFTNTIYFTDEASAREGESKSEPPAEIQTLMSDARFLDLRDPWFESA
jgi:hypothetical protein